MGGGERVCSVDRRWWRGSSRRGEDPFWLKLLVAMAFSLVAVALLVVVPVPDPVVYLFICISVLQFFLSPPHYQLGQNTHYYSVKRENAG